MNKKLHYLAVLLSFGLISTACSSNVGEENSSNTNNKENVATEESVDENTKENPDGDIKTGTYTAETNGFGGSMEVEVSLGEDKIESINIVKDFETPGVGKVALEKLSKEIVDNNTTNVDALTGATHSSNAIKNSVRDALTQAGASEDQFNDELAKKEYDSEKEADVVIVGGGGAGLSAAVAAGQKGASVIVLETNGYAGGNLVVSGGVYNSPDPENQPAQGIEDSNELFAEQTLEGGDNVGDPEMVKILADNAYDGLNWLKDLGVEFDEEIIQAPGALHPRSHNTPAPLGTGIVNTYLENIDSMDNVEVLYETKAEDLIEEDGKISEVIATNPDGSELKIKANNGVVLATGGFSKNTDMVLEYADKEKWPQLDEKTVSTNLDSIKGDGIRMAQDQGADTMNMDQMQFLYLGTPKTGLLSGVYNVSAEIVLFVNNDGERFVAEDERRDVISSAVFDQEDGMMWMVHSADSLSDPENQPNIDGIPMSELLDTGAYGWKKGDTIEELAEEMGVPAENLRKSIEDYNNAVDSGDDEFGRKLLTTKFETGPYYALPRVPSLHHTMGGLRIDTEGRVLDADGEIIPGLYAGGEITGGIHGANRLGGNAVTDTVVFGRLAGESAAENK